MSKYVYIKKLNKIFIVNEYVQKEVLTDTDCLVRKYADEKDVDCYRVDEAYYSDYIEFDNFEDLIDVGDMIVIDEKDITLSKTLHWVWKINKCFHTSLGRLTKGFTVYEINKIEIYKHVGKDFIRVCHKDNGNWVID